MQRIGKHRLASVAFVHLVARKADKAVAGTELRVHVLDGLELGGFMDRRILRMVMCGIGVPHGRAHGVVA